MVIILDHVGLGCAVAVSAYLGGLCELDQSDIIRSQESRQQSCRTAARLSLVSLHCIFLV